VDRGRVARFPDSRRPGSDRRRRGRRSRRRRSPVGAADLAPAAVPERQRVLLAITEALYAGAEELSLLTAADTRNALRTQARPESQTLANLFRYFGGIAGELEGTVLPAGDGQLQYSIREPVGVVGAVLPWNSPLMIAGMKIPAALAAGNTMVVEPAEDAPLTVLELTEICSRFPSPGELHPAGAELHRQVAALGPAPRRGIGREFSLEGMLESFSSIKQINVELSPRA